MNSSTEQLSQLLQSGKITADEFELLSQKLKGKKSPRAGIKEIVLNPFQRVAGLNALLLGGAIMIFMSVIASFAQHYYPSALSLQIFDPKEIRSEVWVRLAENIGIVLILGTLSFLISKGLTRKPLRWVDFVGTIALARYPYAVLTLGLFFLTYIFPEIKVLASSERVNMSTGASLSIAVLAFSGFTWQILAYFYAIKESSGLIGKKLALTVVTSLILAEGMFLSLPSSLAFWKKPANYQILKTQEAETMPEEKFAREWLGIVDSGQDVESWNLITKSFQEEFPPEKWKTTMENVRKPLGRVIQRDMISKSVDGQFIDLVYRTQYEKGTGDYKETLSVIERSGKWIVAGYIIKPM
jgi:hypothetical protein